VEDRVGEDKEGAGEMEKEIGGIANVLQSLRR